MMDEPRNKYNRTFLIVIKTKQTEKSLQVNTADHAEGSLCWSWSNLKYFRDATLRGIVKLSRWTPLLSIC